MYLNNIVVNLTYNGEQQLNTTVPVSKWWQLYYPNFAYEHNFAWFVWTDLWWVYYGVLDNTWEQTVEVILYKKIEGNWVFIEDIYVDLEYPLPSSFESGGYLIEFTGLPTSSPTFFISDIQPLTLLIKCYGETVYDGIAASRYWDGIDDIVLENWTWHDGGNYPWGGATFIYSPLSDSWEFWSYFGYQEGNGNPAPSLHLEFNDGAITVDFGNLITSYPRLTPSKASNPTPTDGAVDVPKNITLFTWEI
jgi:hypothetical protein